jgi:hypothetical protein
MSTIPSSPPRHPSSTICRLFRRSARLASRSESISALSCSRCRIASPHIVVSPSRARVSSYRQSPSLASRRLFLAHILLPYRAVVALLLFFFFLPPLLPSIFHTITHIVSLSCSRFLSLSCAPPSPTSLAEVSHPPNHAGTVPILPPSLPSPFVPLRYPSAPRPPISSSV